MWAYSQDVGGQHTAAVLGWANMWGNFGAALSPLLVNYLLGENQDNWDMAFAACGIAFIVSGVAGMFIDATKKIDPDEDL
jgi:nitrate/nitrite transporter NarK